MDKDDKILIASSTKNLVLLRKFIEAQAIALHIDERTISQIILSVDEACTNIIKHAHGYDENKHIEIKTKMENGQFKITLKYKGKAFNPNEVESPDMNEYFSQFKVGGLGVPIMKKFMNKIEFVKKNTNYNYLTLIKSIQSR